jgi:pimeloyl-ACP methyl ester carboxylesterase
MSTIAPDLDWRALRRPGQIVDTGKVRLWIDDVGEGEPIFCLPGMGAGHFIFDFVREYLVDEFRLVNWEPRGLGASERPPGPYGVDVWAEDMRDVLDLLGIERAHLWSTGFGNYYAVRFAARYPERVGGFVSYPDVWAQDPSNDYPRAWRIYGPIIHEYGNTGFGGRLLASFFAVEGVPWFLDWERQNYAETFWPDTADWTAGYCMTEADVRDDLPLIQTPMLVLKGDHDPLGEPAEDETESTRLVLAQVPQVELHVIRDAHPTYALVQRPEECAAAGRAFLRRVPLA